MAPCALAVLLLASAGPPADSVLPNDNRTAAGLLRNGVREIVLEARATTWRPDLGVDSMVSVLAFAEAGGPPLVPAPLVRERVGTAVHITISNPLPQALLVHGLRAGTVPEDTLHVPAGGSREVRYRPDRPGTFLYWGSTEGDSIEGRRFRDAQLTGAIVIDPADGGADPGERIFVLTVIDIFPGDSARNPRNEDVWELAINGRSWPHTERLEYEVGDTVRWRWLNGSYLPHPMHLHGFHFNVLAKGDGASDSSFVGGPERLAVTEFMPPGSTFRMEWVPTRAGAWLMHCHMTPHITPFPARPDSVAAHDLHDVASHPLQGMAGLVLGITVHDPSGMAPAAAHATRHLRLYAQRAAADSGTIAPSSFVLQHDAVPAPDSVPLPASTLLLTRGETTAITVVNRLPEPTTVHWHGMELESVYDGVAGWSRTSGSIAPLLAPGDSFTVRMTPPRAGTYIYHTHMDEGLQLPGGLYGPLLVLEPGVTHDPATDLVFLLGMVPSADSFVVALNGRTSPAALELRVGTTYRLRIINMLPFAAARFRLHADDEPLPWVPVGRDGADLPPALRGEEMARARILGVGETRDFEFTPSRPLDAVLEFRLLREGVVVQYPLRAR